MKSKIKKIQKFKKGMAFLLSLMFIVTPMVSPIAYAASSGDEDYKNVSLLEILLEGKIGSTVSDIVEYFKGETTIKISNETQLRALAELVNNGEDCAGKVIYLTNDIVIDDKLEWIPIGTMDHQFKGTFDGQNHKIIGLEYLKEGKNYEELSNIGLFGVIGTDATICNVITEDFNIDIFYDESDIKANSGSTKGAADTFYQNAGNIAGINYGRIENCKNISDIRGGSNVGGFVGTNEGTIINCTNNASVIGYDIVGGIAGTNKGTIKACVNMSDVKGAEQDIGGIAGLLDNGIVEISYNTYSGNVEGNTLAGELCVGGIVGSSKSNTGSIKYCLNKGKVTYKGTSKRIYEIIGDMSTEKSEIVKDCLDVGSIESWTGLNKAQPLKEESIYGGSSWGYLAQEPFPHYYYFNGPDLLPDEWTEAANIMKIGKEDEQYGYSIFTLDGDYKEGDKNTTGYFQFNPIVEDENDYELNGGIDIGFKEDEDGEEGEEGYTKPEYQINLDDKAENATIATIKIYKNGEEVENDTYLKEGDILTVETIYNKKLYTFLGSEDIVVAAEKAPKISIIMDGDIIPLEIIEVNNDSNTVIKYQKEITKDIKNGKISKLQLQSDTIYYAIDGEIPTDTTKYDPYKVTITEPKELEMNRDNIYVDTKNPTIKTTVYGEKEGNRYTEGEKIFVTVTTSEAIVSPCEEVPEIELSFANGIKRNLESENAIINEDGTTTWIYSYEIQEGDEGNLTVKYIKGIITDLAGNEITLVDEYIVNEESFAESDTYWNENLNVIHDLYENDLKIDKVTYFTEGEDLKVVVTFDQLLYSIDNTVTIGDEQIIGTEEIDEETAPSLYLPGDIKATTSEVFLDKTVDNQKTIITYTFEDVSKNYTDLTIIKNLKLVNDNNKRYFDGEINKIIITTDARLIKLRKGDTKGLLNANASKILNIENVIINPKNIDVESGKYEIYVDTTAPTVEITTDPEGPTNKDEVRYTFIWSEEVVGFDEKDIIVNFGEKVTITEGEGEEVTTRVAFEKVEGAKNTYTLLVKPSTTEGNEGELQVVIPAGVCKDLVGKQNMPQENSIVIDKVQPNFVSWNIKEDEDVVIIEAIFNEAISEAPELTLTIGDIESKGNLEENISKNIVTYTYTPNAADGGKIVATLSGVAKDVAGNSSEEIKEVLESDFELTRTLIKPDENEDIWYTFEKNESSITDFAKPTYFVKGDKISVTKHWQGNKLDEEGNEVLDEDNKPILEPEEAKYEYEVSEDMDLTYMKYMTLTESTEGEEIQREVSFSNTEESGSIDISKANIFFDTIAPELTLSAKVEKENENSKYKDGQEIIIFAETSEIIQDKTEVPQINVSFSVSGIGKYNYQGTEATVGNAQHIETITNEDGTTTWKYKYVVQNGDEGSLKLEYAKEDSIKDIAGNVTKLEANLETPVEGIVVDTTLPTVIISTDKTNPTKESEVTYTFTWSEKITGFGAEDIIVPETAVKGNLTANGNTYTMTVNYNDMIPNGNQGEVTVAVVENAVQDLVGYTNTYVSNTLKIDRISPIIESLAAHAEVSIELSNNVDTTKEYYKAGDIVKIVATFNESVENSTAPTIALKFSESGNAKGTVSEGAISGNKITYTYEITEGDLGLLSVKKFSGKVIDAAGNETIVSNKTLEGDTIIADTVAPKLVGITAIAPNFEYDELLKDGETKRYGVKSKTRETNTITIIAEYSENVYNLTSNRIDVITVAPELKLKFGTGATKTATFDKVEGNKVYYTYDIAQRDNGELSIVSLTGNVSDIAGNTLEVKENSLVFGKYEESITEENEVEKIIADTTKSNITYTTSAINYDDDKNVITGNGTQYRRGAVITVTATTNEYVYKNTDKALERFTKETAPELSISFTTSGEGKGTATNVEYKDNKTVFTYIYEIKDNDNGQLTLNIDELVGYDIALNGNNEKEEKKDIYADTINPVTNWQSWVESEGYGIEDLENGIWKVTFSEKLYVYDNINYKVGSELSNSNKDKAPILLVSNDNATALETTVTNIATNDDGKTVITYSYTPYAKNIGAYGMKFASVSDKAGNLFNLKDQVAPVLENIKVTSPEAGTYKAGEVVTIVATFSEKITGTVPTLALQFADSGDAKGTVSAGIIEENTITYTYTIVDGDNGELQVKSFTGTGLSDLSDNQWVAPETVTLSGNRIVADTIKPVINKVEVKNNNTVVGSYVRQPEAYNPGKTNANEIEYVITFSEDINLVNQDLIELTNGVISKVVCEGNKLIVTAKITTEGVQSLSILEGAVVDLAKVGGNTNEFFRFNGLTVDFTKPTVRFVSEYNGGLYVLPTSIGKVEIRTNVEINEEISKIEYKWDNEENYDEITEYSSASDIVVPTKEFNTEGKHTLYIKVTDIAGNITIASKEYNVVRSEINIEPSITELTNQDVTVTVEFEEGLTDNRRVAFKLDGTEQYKGITPNSDGIYTIRENGTIYTEATDKVGNKVFAEEVIDNIDKVDPVIEIDLYRADLVIGTGKENATIKTYVDVIDNEILEYTKFVFLQEDINEYSMSATDKAKITNNLNGEAKIENAESTKGKTPYYLYVLAKDEAGNEIVRKAGPFTVLNTNKDKITAEDENGEEVTETIPEEIDIKKLIDFNQEGKEVRISYNNFGTDEEYLDIIKEIDVTLTKAEDGYYYDSCVHVNKPTTISVVGTDACGNTVTATYEVTKESIKGPEFEVYGNPENWTNQSIELEVSANEELKSLTINGKNILSEDKFGGKDIIAENGDYRIVATDVYGLTSEKVIKVTKIDKELPTISEAKISKLQGSERAITITAEDSLSEIAEYAITYTTELPVEWSKSNEIKVTHDGNFYVWVKDNAGNIARYEKVVILDTTAPIIRFDYTLLTVVPGVPIETIISTNEEAKISYSWDKETWVDSEEFITSVKVTESYEMTGKYTLYAKAIDKTGNVSSIESIEFNVTNPEEVLDPQIVFEDLPTQKIGGVYYVKVSDIMTTEDVTNKMNKEALCGLTPEYTKLTEGKELKTGSEILLRDDVKYIVVVSGDINCDGKVTFTDIIKTNAVRISEGESSLSTAQLLAADINNTNKIEFRDIISINAIRINSAN